MTKPRGVQVGTERSSGALAPRSDVNRTGVGVRSKAHPLGGRRVRLDDAITYFLNEWPAEGPSPNTVRTYAGQLKWLSGFAIAQHSPYLADLTPHLLRAAMANRMAAAADHGQNYRGGEASAHNMAHATRALARWLLAQGVPMNNIEVVKVPRVPERVQPRLRADEFAALESAILRRLVDPGRRVPRVAIARDLALIYFLADTGLRASEVCALTLKSIDFERGCVHVLRGKGNKDRVLSLVDPADVQGGSTLRLLHDWILARATVRLNARNQQLWTSVRGKPLSPQELRRVLAKLCESAGLDSNRPPHAFRRSTFTEGYLADPSAIRVLAARMGWSPRSHHMIDVYTRGANIDLIATTPIGSVSARLRKSTMPDQSPRPILLNGGGPERVESDRAAPSRRLGKVGDRPAGQPARGRRLLG